MGKNHSLIIAAWVLFVSLTASDHPDGVPFPRVENRNSLINSFPGPSLPEIIFPGTGAEPDSMIIPLKRAGRLFLIDAVIDGQTGNLIFDTGSQEVVLNSTYFRNYKKSGTVSSSGITGEVGPVEQITVGKMEFAELKFTHLTGHLTDLGHIEDRKGVKILGLFGFDLLRRFEIIIDAANNELKLYRLDKYGERISHGSSGFQAEYSQKIEGSGVILFLNGTVGGKLLNFCLDTAAETNVISSSSGKPVLTTLTITRRTTLKGAGSSASEVLYGRMNNFEMGRKEIRNMETVVSSLFALDEAYNSHIDGILGCSFLEHGTVCVNFVKSQVGVHFTETQSE